MLCTYMHAFVYFLWRHVRSQRCPLRYLSTCLLLTSGFLDVWFWYDLQVLHAYTCRYLNTHHWSNLVRSCADPGKLGSNVVVHGMDPLWVIGRIGTHACIQVNVMCQCVSSKSLHALKMWLTHVFVHCLMIMMGRTWDIRMRHMQPSSSYARNTKSHACQDPHSCLIACL